MPTHPSPPRPGGATLGLAALLAAFLSACAGGGSGGAVNSCSTFTSPGTGDGAPFTLTGSVAYQDLTFNANGFTGGSTMRAARQATVQVVRCSDSAILGTDTSGPTGAFSVTASNAGPLGVYVRILAQILTTNFDVAVKDQSGSALYALRSTAFDERIPPALDLSAMAAAGIGAPFNILDQALIAVAYVDASVPLAGPLPALTMVWEAGTTDMTAYFPSATVPKIEVLDQPAGGFPDTDGYDDMVILHELGHYLADQLSRDDSPGGSHSSGSVDQDARLSWSEGWGNFYSGAAFGGPDYVDTFPGGGVLKFSLEEAGSAAGGATSELGVARALWDGLDGAPGGPSDGDGDGVALGPVPILEAFEDLQGGGGPVEFMRFWNAFRVANYLAAPADVAGFQTAAAGNGIDLVEDDGSDDLAAAATAMAAPTPSTPSVASANLDWDATAGSGPDVDHFRIPLTAAVQYTLVTTALSDGADTLLTILDAGGNPLSPAQANDNLDNVTYPNCDATFTLPCPVNGPYPLGSDPEPLSSRIVFTPPATADYVLKVTRSTAAPLSAGLFGGYDLQVSR